MLRRLILSFLVPIIFCLGTQGAYAGEHRDRSLSVMTRNVDAGSDFGFVLSATDELSAVMGVTKTYQEMVASNFPERADGIAAEIQAKRPDLIGLQEVTTLSTGPYGGPATTVVYDQLQLLLSAIKLRRLHYQVVALQTNADIEMPAFSDFPNMMDVRLTDFDVILARTDLPVSEFKLGSIQKQHFTATVELPVLGQTVPVLRGWISVDAKMHGKKYRFVTTHLEDFDFNIQAAQAIELVNGPLNTGLPVILAGDLNSDANDPNSTTSPAYHVVVNAGLQDVWRELHPYNPGFTWPLHGEDPATTASTPTQRIDLVFERGEGLRPRRIVLVGNTSRDLTPNGFWPSDHAGVIAHFEPGNIR